MTHLHIGRVRQPIQHTDNVIPLAKPDARPGKLREQEMKQNQNKQSEKVGISQASALNRLAKTKINRKEPNKTQHRGSYLCGCEPNCWSFPAVPDRSELKEVVRVSGELCTLGLRTGEPGILKWLLVGLTRVGVDCCPIGFFRLRIGVKNAGKLSERKNPPGKRRSVF